MATSDDEKRTSELDEEAEGSADSSGGPLARLSGEGEPLDEEVGEGETAQLGTQRFVYAGYLALAMLAGFLLSKVGTLGWQRLSAWKPQFGEPREDVVLPIAGLIGVGIALYCWRHARLRQYIEDTAVELSKVTWPSRTEVTNNTLIVVGTTLFATVFFALMDRFWAFVTNLVYGT